MNLASPSPALSDSIERIQSLFAELRQTETLASQVQEMVLAKRQRLDHLMQDFLARAAVAAVAAEPPPAPAPASAPVSAPVAAPAPNPAAPKPAAPKPAAPEMPLSPHGTYGAPRDLLRNQPAPSAQHVLDSLNRLMAGMKDQSAKSANAA
jgi:hypothetical protein